MESVPLENQDECGRVTPKRMIRNCAFVLLTGSGPGRIKGFCVDVSGCRSSDGVAPWQMCGRQYLASAHSERLSLTPLLFMSQWACVLYVPGTLAACCLWALRGTWYEAHTQQGVRVNALPCLIFKITAQFWFSWLIENIEIHFKCEMTIRSRTYKIKYQLTTNGHKNNKRWFLIKYKPFQKQRIH